MTKVVPATYEDALAQCRRLAEENEALQQTVRTLESELRTARATGNQELDAHFSLLDRLVRHLPGMAYCCDDDEARTLRFVSQGITGLTGHTPEELMQGEPTGFGDLVHADDREYVLDTVWASVRRRLPFELVYFAHTKNGRGRWLWEQGQGVFDESGNLLGIFGFITDATDRKQAEDALLEAKLVADVANLTKSEFLTNISQEIRTPLTSILGFATMIQLKLNQTIVPALNPQNRITSTAATKVMRNVDIIVHECERLTALINDVLDVARLDAGKVVWKSAIVSVTDVVKTAAKVLNPLVEQKALRLAVDMNGNLPPVSADRDRLIQVMINLITNAVRFTDKGTITCSAEAVDGFLHVHVADTGAGIPPEYQASIFDPFKQVGESPTDKPHGTGLGLPICKQIINYHGGDIWVDSELGQGSTFTFSLPL